MAPETDKRVSRRTPCFTAVYISHPEDGERERNRQGETGVGGWAAQKYTAADSLHLDLTR